LSGENAFVPVSVLAFGPNSYMNPQPGCWDWEKVEEKNAA
jgi:hypothetical protein